ncbi:BID domain-containing T4SS effector, partial [Bartonella rattimassiliensis]
PTSSKPPRMKDRVQNDIKIQENSSTHTKVAPPPPPRIRAREQSKQTVQENDPPYAMPAPPKPPRLRNRVQNDTKIQNSDALSPSVRPKTSSHVKIRQQSSSSSQDSELYTSRKHDRIGNKQKSDSVIQKTTSSQTSIEQPNPSHRQKTSSNKMERELLLSAYQEEIRFLCEKVYGNRLILNEKIEELKENPDMGDQLLWDVTESPKSISKLAGRKVFGIKNNARKQAEETLPALCAAINGYVYTSKYTKIENTSPELHTGQGYQRHAQKEESINQQLQNPLHLEKKIKPLSNKEIARRVQKDPSVQYGQREIQYWCQIVYKDPFILQYRIEDIQKIPEMGEELVFQIENNSTSFAPLAGKQILGVKNEARKAAEENLPTLCTAIKNYAETVKQARENIVQHHQEQQKRHQPFTEIDKKQQKNLSQSPQFRELSTTKRHFEIAEASTQEDPKLLPLRSRRTETSKAMGWS